MCSKLEKQRFFNFCVLSLAYVGYLLFGVCLYAHKFRWIHIFVFLGLFIDLGEVLLESVVVLSSALFL